MENFLVILFSVLFLIFIIGVVIPFLVMVATSTTVIYLGIIKDDKIL